MNVNPAVDPVVTAGNVRSIVTGEHTAAGVVIITVGFWVKLIVTSSVEALHGELLTVHRKTYVAPAVPLNALVGLVGVVMDPPDPLTILHAPVPTAGVLPARVVVVRPHRTDPV